MILASVCGPVPDATRNATSPTHGVRPNGELLGRCGTASPPLLVQDPETDSMQLPEVVRSMWCVNATTAKPLGARRALVATNDEPVSAVRGVSVDSAPAMTRRRNGAWPPKSPPKSATGSRAANPSSWLVPGSTLRAGRHPHFAARLPSSRVRRPVMLLIWRIGLKRAALTDIDTGPTSLGGSSDIDSAHMLLAREHRRIGDGGRRL